MNRAFFVLPSLFVLIALPIRAQAVDGGAQGVSSSVPWPVRLMAAPGYYLSPGISLSAPAGADPQKGQLGVELSLMKFNGFERGKFSWGISTDYTRNVDEGMQRLHVTPTLVAPGAIYRFGVDAGYVGEVRGGERVQHGITGRLFVTVGLLSVYTRVSRVGDRDSLEGGVLIKIPFRVLTSKD